MSDNREESFIIATATITAALINKAPRYDSVAIQQMYTESLETVKAGHIKYIENLRNRHS
ncbi:MAG: hypothetical protein EB060_01930 [Proteobacteria bacterium]|nr:hypothetical protein [Pseudomonadota bacterium]